MGIKASILIELNKGGNLGEKVDNKKQKSCRTKTLSKPDRWNGQKFKTNRNKSAIEQE